MTEPKNRLFVRSLTSIGAVGAGDNPDAAIMFWKSKDLPPETPEPPEGRPTRSEMPLDISVLAEEHQEMVQKELDDLTGSIDDLKAQVAELTPEEEPALPTDLPEPVAKKLAEQDEAIAKANADADAARAEAATLREEKLDEQYAERADQLRPILGDDMAPVLKALGVAAPAEWGQLSERLDVVTKMAALTAELGDSAATGSAVAKIAAIAKTIHTDEREDFPTLVDAKAEAWDRNPDLVTQSRQEGA